MVFRFIYSSLGIIKFTQHHHGTVEQRNRRGIRHQPQDGDETEGYWREEKGRSASKDGRGGPTPVRPTDREEVDGGVEEAGHTDKYGRVERDGLG